MTGSIETYVVEIDGGPTEAHGVSRRSALEFASGLLASAAEHGIQTIAIHEVVTGEPRACWFRDAWGWRGLSVPGWLS